MNMIEAAHGWAIANYADSTSTLKIFIPNRNATESDELIGMPRDINQARWFLKG